MDPDLFLLRLEVSSRHRRRRERARYRRGGRQRRAGQARRRPCPLLHDGRLQTVPYGSPGKVRDVCDRQQGTRSARGRPPGALRSAELRDRGEDPEGWRLRKVRRYDVYGHVPDDLMNTSAIERQNLTIRLLSSRARRRTVTFGRSREAVQASLELLKANYNLCMPHSSLSLRRRENDGKHEPVTPAMRMGLTDHVWSIGELMSFCYRQNIN